MDPLTLMLGSTAISGGAGLFGSMFGANKQAEAAKNALAFQQQVYGQQRSDLAPYRQAGTGAMGMISDLYGLNGGQGFGQNAIDMFYRSPDYAFAFGEGQRALENSAAAKGGLMGGNFARAATNYGQNAANQYFQNYAKNLMGIAGMGKEAATGGGYLSGQMANQIGSSMGNIGTANASGIIGGTNALTQSLGSGVNNYALYDYLNRSSYNPNHGFAPSGDAIWGANQMSPLDRMAA